MKQECLDLIGGTLGRKISSDEGDRIVAAIKSRMSALARSEEFKDKWARMTLQDRIMAAAGDISKDILAAAEAKKAARYKQVIAQNRIVRELDRLSREEDLHAFTGVARILLGVERAAKGIQNEYLSSMLDTINGIDSKWLGFVENEIDVRDFVRQVFGENTGNARAKAAADAWLKTAEDMRQRATRAGAEIGKLDYGYIPQSHDWWKVRRSGREAWVDFILPLVDRARFIGDDGVPMDDAGVRSLLESSWENIVTSGNSEESLFEVAQKVSGNNISGYKKYQHRVLHFKDADSFLEYEKRFGKGSLTGTLVAHVSKMSSDIAILENMGPRAEATFIFMKKIAESEAQNARMSEESRWKLLTKYSGWQGLTDASIDDMWAVLSGKTSVAAVNREGVAQFMSGWRNLEIAGKLGKAFISSFSDIPSYFIATGFNRLDFGQGLRFLFSAYGSDWRDYASRAGLIADSISSDFNRWANDNIGQGWTSKMANATMKASFLTTFTDATRRAFGLNMMASLGKLIDKNWNALDEYDRARLQNAGITARDWQLFQLAGTEEHRGIKFLTLKQLKALKASETISQSEVDALPAKLLGFIVSEGEMASLGPDLVTRAESTRRYQRGTMEGEIVRALYLFKSFPIAMMEKHWRRSQFLRRHGSFVDQLGYVAAVVVSTSVMGALSLQVQSLLNGKDARDMEDRNFWLEALAKGGGLGFLGDYLAYGLSDDARYGAMSGLTNFAGPQIGTAVEASDIIIASIGNSIYHKNTKPGVKATRLVRSHLPFLNMWYTSTAIDRAFMNELNEWMSPGYLAQMEKRQRRGTGQGYWLPLDRLTPSRAPGVADRPEK